MGTSPPDVKAVFDAAVEIGDPADRAAFLDGACARFPDVRREVDGLLAALDRAGHFLSHPLASADPLPPGTRIGAFGDYELQEVVARGSMGVVYKARQISLGRVVALKMIRAGEFADPGEVRRFRTEAEAAAHLNHPHIVPVHAVGEYDGHHYYTMRLVEGGSLAYRMAEFAAPLAAGRAEAWARQATAARLIGAVARAVHDAHQRGILHRDIKPANVLLDPDGTPHVADFGLARRIGKDSTLTRTGTIVGTPSYMAPEQARGREDVTPAADVWGLGAVLYELLTGRPPFRGEDVLDTLYRVRERDPVRPRSLCRLVDRDLETVCLKCLEKDPAKRYPKAAELADDLDRWLAGRSVRARRAGAAGRAAKWARRNPSGAGLVGVGVLTVVAAVGALVALSDNARMADRQGGLERRTQELADALERAYRLPEADDGSVPPAPDGVELLRIHLEDDPLGMAVSPVDGTVLTVGDDGRPRQWDPGTGRLVRTFVGGHAAPARAVAVSADGKWALSGGEDKLARLWDVATGREIRRFGPHPWSVVGVAFGPPGRALAASGTLTLWDLESGTRAGLRTYQPPRGTTWVAYSEPAGRAAFCDQSDVHVHLWDPAAWKPIRDLDVEASGAGVVAFSPDGRWLASGRVDGWLRLWDVTTGNTRWTTHAHTQETVDVAFSPDGRWVVSAGGDRTVRVWDAQTGRAVRRYRVPTNNVTRAAFLPDGTRIVSTHRDHTVRVWRVQE